MGPKTIAEELTRFFLENGNFVDSGGPMSLQSSPAGAGRQRVYESEAPAFSGLAVQGVAFEENLDEGQAAVHVYVSRGSKAFLKGMPDEVEDVPVHAHNIGKLYVKPHAASAATNNGNLYIKDDRIACGSSCAPTGKNYAGTFGALGRLETGGPMYVLSNNHGNRSHPAHSTTWG